MYAIIALLIAGGIIGLIARAIVPGDDYMGCLATIVLGIAGSFAGGLLESLFTTHRIDDFHASGLIMSIVGAVLVLIIVNTITGRKR